MNQLDSSSFGRQDSCNHTSPRSRSNSYISDSDGPSSPRRSRSNSVKGTLYAPQHIQKEKYKTELCRSFLERGACGYGAKCQFAHGLSELQTSPTAAPKFKVEICRQYMTMSCPYGKRCAYLHPRLDLTPADDEKVLIELVDALSARSMSVSQPIDHLLLHEEEEDVVSSRQRSFSCAATCCFSSMGRLPVFQQVAAADVDSLKSVP
ncbi:hypothetical protein RCL1_007102 [Eukaryota sp. TZLM3-RCL]